MRRLVCVFVSVLLLSVSAGAVQDVYNFDEVVDHGSVGDVVPDVPPEYVLEGDEVLPADQVGDREPLPVVVVLPDTPLSVVQSGVDRAADLVIGDDPPSSPPFYGAAWVTGTDSRLGRVTLYFPIDYRSGRWGVDSNGYLFNVSSGSMTGYLDNVYNNSISASGFSYPRYRQQSGSSWDYYDLHLRPEHSNMEIAVSNAPKFGLDYFVPYIIMLMLGGVWLCLLRRSKI